jgi:crotonobetainyl-CoA:carnitine CoA-transferase CaiB-like acyl-CoA transferase
MSVDQVARGLSIGAARSSVLSSGLRDAGRNTERTMSNEQVERIGQALAGVRILDMATVVAAPFGAALCADLGAEVIKLELPDGSDPLRGLAPVKDGMPLYWKVTNRGKQGVTLDVRKPEGRELFLQLLPHTDVLVENFRSGTLERWGLDMATLHAANPRLVVLRLTGFGQSGPYRQRAGFARIFEAMSGLTNLTGDAGGPPMHMNFPIGDLIAGLFAATAIAAEMVRMRTDPNALGVEIDLSATEALMRVLEPLAVEHEQLGVVRSRTGNLASYTAPSNMYVSADGVYFSLVASSDATWRRLCQALDMPDLLADARFATNPQRVRHGVELDALLKDWFGQRSYATVSAALDASEVPYSKTYTIEDILRDPQVQAREAIVRLPDPELGSVPAPCIVPRVAGRPTVPTRTGPLLGEHNAEVYGRLGLDAAALDRLRALGVI